MSSIIDFAAFLVHGILNIAIWLIIISAVLSWLVAFGVINMRNRVGYEIVRGLDRATDPLLRPLRRFIPPLGGMDFTPVILILVLTGVDRILVPPFFGWLHSLVAPPALL